MRVHDRECGTGHIRKEDRRGLKDFDIDQTSFELLREVADESRPMISTGDKILELRNHLAAVADAQRKRCRRFEEAAERALQFGVVQNGLRPSAAGA